VTCVYNGRGKAPRLWSRARMAVVDFNLKRETAGDLIVELHAVNGADHHHHHGLAAVPVPPEKAVAILQKPFDPTELLDALQDAASRRSALA
jgi:hypothetical protein